MSITDNYFELFGLPPDFNINLSTLAGKYRELQRNTHPDRFANASQRDQLLSVQYAATINDAYETLKSPLKRAVYLLKLKGIDVDKEHSFDMGQDFLMQQIELREELEAIKSAAEPESALLRMSDELAQYQQQLEKNFSRHIDIDSDDALNKAGQAVNRLQFINKMQLEVERLEDELLGL